MLGHCDRWNTFPTNPPPRRTLSGEGRGELSCAKWVSRLSGASHASTGDTRSRRAERPGVGVAVREYLKRHRAAVAGNTALLVAVSAVLVYVVTTDGYRKQEQTHHDGGVWVTNGDKEFYGRMNKPVGQLDGVVFGDDDAIVDVAQQGAAVVALNRRSGSVAAIDTARVRTSDDQRITNDPQAQVWIAGGTAAALDPATGKLWAARVNPDAGRPTISTLDATEKPLATVGGGASLAISTSGTVTAVSASADEVLVVRQHGDAFAEPGTTSLPSEAGEPTALTAVGERIVSLDSADGTVHVFNGPTVRVEGARALQQPGAAVGSVLVATDTGLVAVDLTSGDQRQVADGASGVPTAPVRLGPCSFGAWSGGSGQVVTQCEATGTAAPRPLDGNAADLVFRVNRDEIALNDRKSGAVWDVDTENPVRIDNWDALTSTKVVQAEDENEENNESQQRRPPKARPDRFGARAGRTSVLHPLDNDSAQKGRLLAITGIEKPGLPGSSATISPDGQTIQLTLPQDATGSTRFRYYISDGVNRQVSSEITVTPPRSGPPQLREGFKDDTVHRVPANGTLELPVLGDWRDPADSDQLTVSNVQVLGAGTASGIARVTSSGRVRFEAPEKGGDARLSYTVTDGTGASTDQTLRVVVQDKDARDTFPATANDDVVTGEVGRAIEVRPLANDQPGSDPVNPQARISLAGKVNGPRGVEVSTDTADGSLSVRAAKPGTYFLEYEAAYGLARLAKGNIRVDVRPRPKDRAAPVAMPDTAMLSGTAATLVDPLVNDVDPAGGMLVVQRAEGERANQVDVAVVDGRWLRISARQGELGPNPQVVRYTVSNGESSSRGEVQVSQRPTPEDNTPVTVTDRVRVRAGSAVVVPVLDNDFSPSGDTLGLLDDAGEVGTDSESEGAEGRIEVPTGQLPVRTPVDVTGDPGQAFVVGRNVRYVAPRGLTEADTYEVPYVATNDSGQSAEGRLLVEIVPEKQRNSAPEPGVVEGRGVAGATIKLRLPGADVDPDGDPVTIVSLESAPSLGRITAYGAGTMEYQAYPGSSGTDEFRFVVVDDHGGRAVGTARVAVAPPGTPQPPLAVPDVVDVAPGRTMSVDPLQNDFISPGDRVEVSLVDPPEGVRYDAETGRVSLQAPARETAKETVVVYQVSNGLATSSSTVTLRTFPGRNNPPVVPDAFGDVGDSARVSVDVLEAAFDPDGDSADLVVDEVYGPEGVARIDGNRIVATRGPTAQVIPFRVRDADGASASASLYVPANGAGLPYVKDGAMIKLADGERKNVKLSDVIADPTGADVRLAEADSAWASPTEGLSASAEEGGATVAVEAAERFEGPGALLVKVPVHATPDERGGAQEGAGQAPPITHTVLSVPVQVGRERPELRCPEQPVEVTQGDAVDIDVTALCHTWTHDPADAEDLTYDAEWATSLPGVALGGSGSQVLRVTARPDARVGSEGALRVTTEDSDPASIRVRVVGAPPPSIVPVRVSDMRPGTSQTLNMASHLRSALPNPEPTVLSAERVSGTGITAQVSGGRVTLRAGAGAEGRATIRVQMSDAGSDAGRERRAETRIEVTVTDVPDAPEVPRGTESMGSSVVNLRWSAPDDNGARIDRYEVRETKSGKTRTCRTTSCPFTGLASGGVAYNFRVRAHNAVGWSEWSGQSSSMYVDSKPGRVRNIRAVERGNKSITLRWDPPNTQTSPIKEYWIRWVGGEHRVGGNTTTVKVSVPDNNRTYSFTILGRNKVAWSDSRTSSPYWPIGTPSAPRDIAAVDLQTGEGSTTNRITWASTKAEGEGPVRYTVLHNGSKLGRCANTLDLACEHPVAYDGERHVYQVVASNKEGKTSSASESRVIENVGRPAPWGAWEGRATGNDQELAIRFTVPDSRGSESRAYVMIGAQKYDSTRQRGAYSTRIRVPADGELYPVRLRVCNENESQGACRDSDVKMLRSYGPLDNQLFSVEPVVNLDTVSWRITGNTNGDPAVLELTRDGQTWTEQLNQTGSFTHTTAPFQIGFNSSSTLRVRLYDNDPSGRGSDSRQSEAETGDPPRPQIQLVKGERCSDNSVTNPNLPGCSADPSPGTGCVLVCWKVSLRSDNLWPSLNCTFGRASASSGGGWNNYTLDATSSGLHNTPLWSSAGSVNATCRYDSGDQSVQSQAAW